MSDSQKKPWSDNPNAPKVPHHLYLDEKANFSGDLVGSILYGTPKTSSSIYSSICTHSARSVALGITIMLVFKCVTALLSPFYRRGEPIRWGLVSYTAVTFLFMTVQTAVALHVQAISYIDNRKFPGIEGVISPGPIGYLIFISHEAFTIVPTVAFFLNGWLSDSLLVRSLLDAAFITNVSPVSPPALSLLRYLLQKPLGYRLSLPHVPRLVGCAFELSKSLPQHSG